VTLASGNVFHRNGRVRKPLGRDRRLAGNKPAAHEVLGCCVYSFHRSNGAVSQMEGSELAGSGITTLDEPIPRPREARDLQL